MNIAGVVLAGGYSTRMQKDKTKISIVNNISMLEKTISLLSNILPNKEIAISCREDTSWNIPILHIKDVHKNIGPLAGIHSALLSLQKDILLLPTDLPLMKAEFLLALLSQYEKDTSLQNVPFVYMYKNIENNKPEPLVSIFRYTALSYIEKALSSNNKRVFTAIPQDKHAYLYYSILDAPFFHNVNYPSDIARAKELVEQSKGDSIKWPHN